MQHNYHLLTGPPGSGKSTLLLELQARGYPTVDEPARQILEEQRSFDGNGVPERSPELFTELMLSRAIALFKQMQGVGGPVFFDRGIVDHVGYASLFGIDSTAAERASKIYRYNTQAFFAPAWEEIYEQDDERRMTFEQARDFGVSLRHTYVRFGYQVLDIPCVSPARRAEFVLEHLISPLS